MAQGSLHADNISNRPKGFPSGYAMVTSTILSNVPLYSLDAFELEKKVDKIRWLNYKDIMEMISDLDSIIEQITYRKYCSVFHFVWLLLVTISWEFWLSSFLPVSDPDLSSKFGTVSFSLISLLSNSLWLFCESLFFKLFWSGPITCIMTSKAPVRGKVQYSNKGKSFLRANLKKSMQYSKSFGNFTK